MPPPIDDDEPGDPAEPWFWPVFGALILLVDVVPLWIGRFLPMVDLPAHLAIARIYHELLHAPATTHYAEWFALRTTFTPYEAFFRTVDWLALAGVSYETAARIFVTLCCAGLPLSVVPLLRVFDRSRWLALFAIPVAYNGVFFHGFLNNLAALPLLNLSIAAAVGHARGDLAPRIARPAIVALPFVLLGAHLQPFAFYLCALAVVAVAFPNRRTLETALAVAPSLALALSWSIPVARGGGAATGVAHAHWKPWFDTLAYKAFRLDDDLFDAFDGQLDYQIGWWLFGCWLYLVAVHARGLRSRAAAVPSALFAGAVAAYYVCPRALLNGPEGHLFVYQRFAPTLACLALPFVPAPPGRVPRYVWLTIAAICAFDGVYVADRFRAFSRELGDFADLAAKVEPDSCVAVLSIDDLHSHVVDEGEPLSHVYQYLAVWRGAIPSFPFAGGLQLPVDLAPGRAFPLLWPQAEKDRVAAGELYDTYGRFYRYFLVPHGLPPVDRFGAQADRIALIGTGGPFDLWESPAAHCGR